MTHREQGWSDREAEAVWLRDDRVRIIDSRRAPYRWVCSLEVWFPEPVYYALGPLESPRAGWEGQRPTRRGCGTGLLIGPDRVLTAAHVITGLARNPARPGRFRLVTAHRIRVIPGRDDSRSPARPFGTLRGTGVRIHPRFRSLVEVAPRLLDRARLRRALAWDVASIHLAAGPARQLQQRHRLGWWGQHRAYRIAPVPERLRRKLSGHTATLAGYPGDKPVHPCGIPFRSSDRIVGSRLATDARSLDLLLYRADTSVGMSGSPVWSHPPGGPARLLGVHSSFLRHKTWPRVNVGVLLSPRVWPWLAAAPARKKNLNSLT